MNRGTYWGRGSWCVCRRAKPTVIAGRYGWALKKWSLPVSVSAIAAKLGLGVLTAVYGHLIDAGSFWASQRLGPAAMSLAIASNPSVRPPGLLYALDEWPPPARLALLGLQYAVMDAIYLVLVAIILRNAKLSAAESVNLMGIACVALAIGTTLQALPRGPVGSGFLAPPVYSATYLAPSVLVAQSGGMSLVFGMTLIAGIMELLIALFLNRLRFVITPVLSGLTVFIVGLQLGVVGVGQMLGVQHGALLSFHLHMS